VKDAMLKYRPTETTTRSI